MGTPFSLYIHIPWCIRKCPYCDFNIHVARPVPEDRYVDALLGELSLRSMEAGWTGRILQSIYFGGGTPSVLGAHAVSRVIRAARDEFEIDASAEIGLELNPEDVSAEYFSALAESGVNRISVGGQSFSDRILKRIGRRHSREHISAAVSAAREAGIENVNLDIIFGVPCETLEEFGEDLNEALGLSPRHISLYGLTIEEGTPFFRDHEERKLELPSDDLFAAMMERGHNFLSAHGFTHYEISNYAIPGFESRHNLAYWNGDDYLGLGAGAHSYRREEQKDAGVFGIRFANYSEPSRYMSESERQGTAEAWRERLDADSARFEFFFLGLRKLDGVDLERYRELFNENARERYGHQIDSLCRAGLLCEKGPGLSLTMKGLLVADSVIGEFA